MLCLQCGETSVFLQEVLDANPWHEEGGGLGIACPWVTRLDLGPLSSADVVGSGGDSGDPRSSSGLAVNHQASLIHSLGLPLGHLDRPLWEASLSQVLPARPIHSPALVNASPPDQALIPIVTSVCESPQVDTNTGTGSRCEDRGAPASMQSPAPGRLAQTGGVFGKQECR